MVKLALNWLLVCVTVSALWWQPMVFEDLPRSIHVPSGRGLSPNTSAGNACTMNPLKKSNFPCPYRVTEINIGIPYVHGIFNIHSYIFFLFVRNCLVPCNQRTLFNITCGHFYYREESTSVTEMINSCTGICMYIWSL